MTENKKRGKASSTSSSDRARLRKASLDAIPDDGHAARVVQLELAGSPAWTSAAQIYCTQLARAKQFDELLDLATRGIGAVPANPFFWAASAIASSALGQNATSTLGMLAGKLLPKSRLKKAELAALEERRDEVLDLLMEHRPRFAARLAERLGSLVESRAWRVEGVGTVGSPGVLARHRDAEICPQRPPEASRAPSVALGGPKEAAATRRYPHGRPARRDRAHGLLPRSREMRVRLSYARRASST